MDKTHAEREIAAHELAAKRNPAKHEQHMLAARLLRQEHGIPEPEPIVSPITSSNREAQSTEAERIKQWKQSR